MREELDLFNFGVVICDECHYLKNQRAARTKVAVPPLHCVLLGSPHAGRVRWRGVAAVIRRVQESGYTIHALEYDVVFSFNEAIAVALLLFFAYVVKQRSGMIWMMYSTVGISGMMWLR